MEKIAIVTLYGNSNFGNKLQNYAIQTIYEGLGFEVTTLKISNADYQKSKSNIINRVISVVLANIYMNFINKNRNLNFKKFNKEYMKNTKRIIYSFSLESINKQYNYFAIGSDQVWNPYFGLKGKTRFLYDINYNKKFSYSASFGVNDIPQEKEHEYKNGLNNIKYISVREDKGKEIVERTTKREDVEVLIDPTMLLTPDEWEKVCKKPKKIINKKYILNYFLGDLSEKRMKEIKKIAKENDCEIINLLDKKSPMYNSGPSEFLWLEKNAFLICTDSFHSSVFAILYNIPFVVFDREDNLVKMNSRIETLINKLKIKNRIYNGKNITKENLEHDYTEAYRILEKERKKSITFLKKALNIKERE